MSQTKDTYSSGTPDTTATTAVEQPYDFSQPFFTNREAGPRLTLHPAVEAVREMDAERQLLGLPVGYPIGVPASPLTASAVWIRMLAEQGFNVLTYKTNRTGPRGSQPTPNWLFLDDLEEPLSIDADIGQFRAKSSSRQEPRNSRAFSMANSFGIPSLRPDAWTADIADALAVLRAGQILIVSVVGDYEKFKGQQLIDDFVRGAILAEGAISAHPDNPCGRAIELNLSCPNTVADGVEGVEHPICETPESVHLIVKAVRAALRHDTKLVVKLGYLKRELLADVITDIAKDVDGVAGINTLQVTVLDAGDNPAFRGTIDDPNRARDKAGLSGVAIRDFALDFVRSLALLRRTNNWRFSIIGMGGVMEPHDVRMLLASGADAVQTSTAASNHPRFPSELLGSGRPEPSAEEKLVQLLATTLSDTRWEFRTQAGLAKELNLKPDEVDVLLRRHPEIARASVVTTDDGRELYTHRDRPVSARERLEQARSLIAHSR